MKMLEGVKVLDFTINAAGPIVGAYFADYGAEVVKIEPQEARPDAGSPTTSAACPPTPAARTAARSPSR